MATHPYEPPGPFAERFKDPYDGEVAYVDEQVGRLLDGLQERGLMENTWVIISSDHGDYLGEKNLCAKQWIEIRFGRCRPAAFF
mgnify:CR=1 FL=1